MLMIYLYIYTNGNMKNIIIIKDVRNNPDICLPIDSSRVQGYVEEGGMEGKAARVSRLE